MKINILQYFEETVKNNPDKIAVMHNAEKYTFKELQQKSKCLGGYIRKITNEVRNRPVCVFLPKNFYVAVSDIAATYSRNLFNNLDIKTPQPRLQSIADVLNPIVVITDKQHEEFVRKISGSFFIIVIDAFDWTQDYQLNDVKDCISLDPFCIINTSGSTGTPKGVVLTHGGFIDYVIWACDTFKFDGSEILGVMSAIVFDHYVYETALMMMRGSTLVLLDMMMASFPARLLAEIESKKVNYIFWVPTVMVNIANMGLLERFALPDLKMIWFAGEVFPTRQFNIWRKRFPSATFVNLYGPCEITVDCTYHIVDENIADNQSIPIGKSRSNVDVFLLDDNNKLCKKGIVGEICVRSSSIALGYYNNPVKTAEVFVQNPLNTVYPEKIYRTGDLAYEDDRGVLIFKGRKDNMIKHMGNRVELGEIEHAVINTLQLVKNGCAVYDHGKKEIVFFYEAGQELSVAELRKKIVTALPPYMVPTKYVWQELLPRNTNGKIDRLKLKESLR